MNIGSLLPGHARYRPEHTAVVFEDRRLNFREFNDRVNQLANALSSLHVKKGDKVATILPNCLNLLETYWAVAKMGAVVVPLSPLLRGRALAALLPRFRHGDNHRESRFCRDARRSPARAARNPGHSLHPHWIVAGSGISKL